MTWRACSLGDVVTLKRGYDLPKRDRSEGPFPIISSSGTTGSHKEAKVQPPGVVTGRYGTLGEVYYVDEPFWPLNTTLYVQDFHGNHPSFIAYFLRDLDLARYEAASAVPGLNRNHLHTVDVSIPSVPVQERIASILSAFDHLIANNNRRIDILEEMARAIYRHWFVEFKYPGHEDVLLVESELGPIPEGWGVGSVGDLVANIREGVDPEALDPDVPYVGLEHIPQQSLILKDRGSASDVSSRKWLFESGDVLFAKLRPYFHKVSVTDYSGITSTDAFVIRPVAARSRTYALMVVSSSAFVDYASAHSTGTDRPRADWEAMARYQVPAPPNSLLRQFDQTVSPLIALSLNLQSQAVVLRQSRDLLLPKLVSGEIDVSGLDIGDAA